jgi:acetyl-CoA carboxylase carboxyl transferase subunit alpha
MRTYLDFEKPIAELESKVAELKALATDGDSVPISDELTRLETKAHEALVETYAELTPWQKTQVARHPERPHFTHYVQELVRDFTPMAGDRYFAEDEAIIGGIGRLAGRSVMAIGHEKGSDTEGRIKHNFGMARPEGYRKAVRLMEMADKFSLPVVSLVDTAGAYPGIGAEERGQAEAIAFNLKTIAMLKTPIINVVIGEGGSGGALGIGYGDQLMMLEYAFYSVISPEGCAAIVWKDQNAVEEAAENLGIRATTLLEFGIIDKIIPEPPGGAHVDPEQTFKNVDKHIYQALKKLETKPVAELLDDRYKKIRKLGVIEER